MATSVRPAASSMRGRDGGAVATGAVHPHLAGGDLVDAAGQLVDRDVDGAVDAGLGELVRPAYVEHDDLAVVSDLAELGEGRRPGSWPARRSVQSSGFAGVVRGGAVDADPDQLALRLGDVVGGLTEQGDGGPPRDQPAEVGREATVEPEVEGAGRVAGSEGGAGAQVDDPLPRFDPTAQLARVGELRACSGRARTGRPRCPAPCARSTSGRRPDRRSARGRRSPRPGSARGWRCFSLPIVDSVASDWEAAQNEPKPCVGRTSVASGSVSASR